jgi:hypothetical protein
LRERQCEPRLGVRRHGTEGRIRDARHERDGAEEQAADCRVAENRQAAHRRQERKKHARGDERVAGAGRRNAAVQRLLVARLSARAGGAVPRVERRQERADDGDENAGSQVEQRRQIRN